MTRPRLGATSATDIRSSERIQDRTELGSGTTRAGIPLLVASV
ncbi:hypothetical protein [Rhodococcus sp. CX]|nr:hypothetical protein [Rhodococcus sp. CX]